MDGRRDTWEESADYFRGYDDGRFDALKENEYKCADSWRLGYADGKRDAAERIDDPVLKDIISGKGLLPIYATDETPTADVVKVTRCKDCWAYETAEYYDGYKKRFCHLFKRQMQEDDFCSLGEPPNQFEKHSAAHMEGGETDDVVVH